MHVISSQERVGLWSQKSNLAPSDEARKIMQKGTWRALDSQSFELVWEQSVDGTVVTFKAVFDVMNP